MAEWVYTSSQSDQRGLSKTVLMVVGVWFAVIFALSISGGFVAVEGQRPVLILTAITMPVILFSLLYLFHQRFKSWVLSLDLRQVILLHSWRTVGLGFVFLYFQGQMPALFAFPAGLGDAMAAIGAVFIAVGLYDAKIRVTKRQIFVWNLFGLTDFIVAVTLGVLTRSGEVFHFGGAATSDALGTFPLVLIPAFAVPFYVILHLIVFAQLRNKRSWE